MYARRRSASEPRRTSDADDVLAPRSTFRSVAAARIVMQGIRSVEPCLWRVLVLRQGGVGRASRPGLPATRSERAQPNARTASDEWTRQAGAHGTSDRRSAPHGTDRVRREGPGHGLSADRAAAPAQ